MLRFFFEKNKYLRKDFKTLVMAIRKLFNFIIFFNMCLIGYSQPISQWRGLNRDGIFHEKNLLKIWPENGPEMLWTNDSIGEGYGSVSVSNDTIFVNGRVDEMSYIFAIDKKGKILWKTQNGIEFKGAEFAANFPGSRSAPTVFKNFIYASSGNGRICCLEKKTGKEIWSVEMIKDLGGIMNQHGYCESLLVDDENVYCLPGGNQINVASLNRKTGKTVWTTEAMKDTSSYCSPMMISLPSLNILVTFSGYHLLGIDIKTGKLLWSHRQAYHEFHQQCNTPVYYKGSVYYLAGEGNGAVRLDLSADGTEIKEKWRNSDVKNLFGGFVIHNDKIYTTEKTQKLISLDINTGEVNESLRLPKGGLIFADGMLYCYSENGNINLINIEKPGMEISGKFMCNYGTKEHFAHPVIANGILYIRHGKSLMAYNIKQP